MKSPITGKEMQLRSETGVEMKFRNESFFVTKEYWLCSDSRERFTTDEMDGMVISNVHRQYKEKLRLGNDIVFPN